MNFTKPSTWKDWGVLLTAWAAAIAVFSKAVFGWELEGYVGPFVAIVLLTVFLLWNLYGIWNNQNVTKRAKAKQIAAEQNPLEVKRVENQL